ncbi:hypothetical protein J1605_001897 [Eschrichtius robustus]|uniref:Uncharacterized protein n=1 Tax=Eschrichtius robustus TaxID=9764 RepID=A0AB34HW70_ESCRO|nr:hypothetical protein J1605_001897 [Eschrichtius robustus]
MACCRQEGKDRITLVTREDRETPSNAELVADDPSDPYEEHGLILPNRDDINWNHPCLGGWPAAHECMQKYPDLYPQEEEKPADRLEETAVSEAATTKEERSS